MPFDIRTDYILESGSPVVKLRTTALFGENSGCQEDISGATVVTDAPEQVDESDPSLIQIALDAGVAFGDFYLQGGSLNVFTPGIGFDEKGHVHELNLAEVNTFTHLSWRTSSLEQVKTLVMGSQIPVVRSTFLYLPHKLLVLEPPLKLLRSHLQMTLPLSLFQMGTLLQNVVSRSNQ